MTSLNMLNFTHQGKPEEFHSWIIFSYKVERNFKYYLWNCGISMEITLFPKRCLRIIQRNYEKKCIVFYSVMRFFSGQKTHLFSCIVCLPFSKTLKHWQWVRWWSKIDITKKMFSWEISQFFFCVCFINWWAQALRNDCSLSINPC